jgi:dephospho-CoA kinase
MIKVGITGDIGSGKTIVCRIFEHLGIHVFDSDTRAKEYYYREDVKQNIEQLFGKELFNPDGEIDKKKLAQIVFSDSKSLNALNELIHPLVLEEYKQWIDFHKNETYTLMESALIYPCKLTHFFDKIIFVEAPLDLRIKRVLERDKTSLGFVKQRIEKQFFEKDSLFNPDFVILNDERHLIVPQILEIHNDLKHLKIIP